MRKLRSIVFTCCVLVGAVLGIAGRSGLAEAKDNDPNRPGYAGCMAGAKLGYDACMQDNCGNYTTMNECRNAPEGAVCDVQWSLDRLYCKSL